MQIDEKTLMQVDLNSLLVMLVVHREQSVSKAAICLGVTQPAVSNTLAKLRVRFDDPLFVSRSRRLQPTAFSHPLLSGLVPAFLDIQKLLQGVGADTGLTQLPRYR